MMDNMPYEDFKSYSGMPMNDVYNREMTERDMMYMDMITGKFTFCLIYSVI